ncbi:cinnamoyl-CoA reductase [Penicillium brasilianum]|uniref:Cinnamoyl-CoA reductase n=1 Tax=Penicillium brasilianum TaxID=104259 RepID=A0A1S9RYH6_PENBI|nr:cinnamoyl-CoA reductase [Penicillium brasilianum]
MTSDIIYTIPQGSKILVTGSNGFIGSHVVDQLLKLGYLIRGTLREPKPWLTDFFDQKYGKGKFEAFILPDVTSEICCERAVEGISGVIHMAADVSMNPDPSVVIPNTVKATLNILKAASKRPTVKQVVLTSSSTAAYTPNANGERTMITQDTWNDAAVEAAWDENAPPHSKGYFVYVASKTETEREAFKWVEETKPHFIFNTVLPALTFGKILAPGVGGSTQSFVRNLLKGDGSAMAFLPPQWFVNVADVARLHVAALLSPSVKFERIFAFAAPQNWTEIIRILRTLRPDNPSIPQEPEAEGQDLRIVAPSRRAEEILKSFFDRRGWVSLEESIAEGISDL